MSYKGPFRNKGRTIVIELNIEGPAFVADFNREVNYFLNHADSSIHMWDESGWADRLLIGTDGVPCGRLRLMHDYEIARSSMRGGVAEPDRQGAAKAAEGPREASTVTEDQRQRAKRLAKRGQRRGQLRGRQQ